MLFDLIIIFLKLALERYSSRIKREILKWISHHSNLNFNGNQQTNYIDFLGFLMETIADASIGVFNSSWNKFPLIL